MPDYPSTIFVRDPIVEGWTDLEASLFNDYRSEVVQLETILGAGVGGSTPKGGFASLADRLDGILSEGGRRRRKLSVYYKNDDGATIPGIAGNVRSDIQVGTTGLLSGPGPHTITYPVVYISLPSPVPPDSVMCGIYIPSGETVQPLVCWWIFGDGTYLYNQFRVYVKLCTGAGLVDPPSGAPNRFKINWAAFAGIPP